MFAYVNKLRVILPERENGSLSMAGKFQKRGIIPLFLIFSLFLHVRAF